MSQQYSIALNNALEAYGAKTFGSIARREERLRRFTKLKNRRYAEEIRLENARLLAQEVVKERARRHAEVILYGNDGDEDALFIFFLTFMAIIFALAFKTDPLEPILQSSHTQNAALQSPPLLGYGFPAQQ